MDLHNIRATLLSIVPGTKVNEYKVTISLDEQETTYTFWAVEGIITGMQCDLVVSIIFNTNQQILQPVIKAVFAYRAGKPVQLPIDLGQYYLGGYPREHNS